MAIMKTSKLSISIALGLSISLSLLLSIAMSCTDAHTNIWIHIHKRSAANREAPKLELVAQLRAPVGTHHFNYDQLALHEQLR